MSATAYLLTEQYQRGRNIIETKVSGIYFDLENLLDDLRRIKSRVEQQEVLIHSFVNGFYYKAETPEGPLSIITYWTQAPVKDAV